MGRKAAFHNLGCKVNEYETEAMIQELERAGYETVPFAPGADVYVINTCTVTNIADRKSRQMLHRAKEMNPSAAVVAVGCYVEDARGRLQADPAVDIIVGNNDKSNLAAILDAWYAERSGDSSEEETVPYTDNINNVRSYEELEIDQRYLATDITPEAMTSSADMARVSHSRVIEVSVRSTSHGMPGVRQMSVRGRMMGNRQPQMPTSFWPQSA